MMTLDEAIKHCEEVAKQNETQADRWKEEGGEKWGKVTACRECANDHRQLAEWLKDYKRLLEQTRWIPCSERLPEENEYVGDVCKYYLIQDEYGDMYVAHLSSVGWIPINSLKAISDEVIAWKPSPEPYKTESEER